MKTRVRFLLACALVVRAASIGQTLKLVTLNLWSGLDYRGQWSIGEYESPEMREKRLHMVEEMLTTTRPDVIALQEVNPVGAVAQRIARACEYDFLYERVNSGLKIATFGIPWNLNEGIVILARKNLRLELLDVWSLSNSFGVIGNSLSFHFAEQNIALVGKIRIDGVSVIIVNVHTIATVPIDSVNDANLARILKAEGIAQGNRDEISTEYRDQANGIRKELKRLSERINATQPGTPMIVFGDLNVAANSDNIREFLTDAGLFDAVEASKAGNIVTWDAEHNINTRYSQDSLDERGNKLKPMDLLSAAYDSRSRRIDYVLLNSSFEQHDVKSARTLLDSAQSGLFASDHYGLLAEVSTDHLLSTQPSISDSVKSVIGSTTEPFPILSYDTDVGFGYGAKLFLLNRLGKNESLDMVLFNSTKGERWYRFVYSLPDFEVRQGRIYPLAMDLSVDYDKYLKNSFFGVGNGSTFNRREYYTREPLEINVSFSRGFSPRVVGQVGLRYKSVRNFNFSDSSSLQTLVPSLNAGTARYHSIYANYRYDSRNSFINPSSGLVLQAEGEYAPQSGITNVQLGRLAGWAQYYSILFYPKTVLALRLGTQALIGNNLPVQTLLSIGGNQTLRGSPQDRFLDETSSIVNAELRFPIYWRFGGVLGYDGGKVWHSSSQMNLARWATNPVVGLRFYMETFVVRMDLGFGNETTGFYLNFGHLF